MVRSGSPCEPSSSQRKKTWPYDEYYFGERDDEERRNGQGENHWTGAEVISPHNKKNLRYLNKCPKNRAR